MPERLKSLDILRGIAIFLVIFGHVTHIPELRNYIWGFHMPIFFFISGSLFNPTKYENFTSFFRKKIKNIVLPYALFYLMTLCYYIIIESNVRGGVSVFKLLIGMFYGSYYDNYMYFNGALWFLPCLFSVEIIGYVLRKFLPLKGMAFALGCYLIGVYLIQNKIIWLPWGINAACIAIIFYSIGFYSKNFMIKYSYQKNFLIISFLGCIACQYLLYPFPKADLASCIIQNYFTYVPIALIGILLYFSISNLIKSNYILEYLGVNSLVLFAFQEPVYRAIIFIYSKILQTNAEIVRQNLIWSLLITITSILVITPLILVYNKWGAPQLKKIKI